MATLKPIRAFSGFVCQSCRARLQPRKQPQRAFSTTPRQRADDMDGLSSLFSGAGMKGENRRTSMLSRSRTAGSGTSSSILDAMDTQPATFESFLTPEASSNLDAAMHQQRQAHRLHIYATKHNTHITLVQPQRPASETASLRLAGSKTSATEQKKVVDVLISVSTGNIGFKKAGRGSYDAAFQLAAYVLRQMQDKGMTRDIRDLEVVLRGFGAGRDAVPKVLLGTEGRYVRTKISAVIDATRLKQGGPRSKKPRRLG